MFTAVVARYLKLAAIWQNIVGFHELRKRKHNICQSCFRKQTRRKRNFDGRPNKKNQTLRIPYASHLRNGDVRKKTVPSVYVSGAHSLLNFSANCLATPLRDKSQAAERGFNLFMLELAFPSLTKTYSAPQLSQH